MCLWAIESRWSPGLNLNCPGPAIPPETEAIARKMNKPGLASDRGSECVDSMCMCMCDAKVCFRSTDTLPTKTQRTDWKNYYDAVLSFLKR